MTRTEYNREYMKKWRDENRQHLNATRRDSYWKKKAVASGIAEPEEFCAFCKRKKGVELIERRDPETLEIVMVRYCGHC